MTSIKCVVWDLDGTVWPGVAIEAADLGPQPVFPQALRAITLLEERGIVSSAASRTDPALAGLLDRHPQLAGRFVAPQLGWGHKSEAIAQIADELGIDTSAMAFVDDSEFERAEVAAVLPGVLVLAPGEFYAQLETPAFCPEVITEAAVRRVQTYRDDARRAQRAAAFAGTHDQFLLDSAIRLSLRAATPADAARVTELVARSHRFNSTGEAWSAQRVEQIIQDDDWFVPVAGLADRFGDYGLIGAALIDRRGVPQSPDSWLLSLFTVSCRAAGRDVPQAFLRWIVRSARAAGRRHLAMRVRPSPMNLGLRILLRGAGLEPVTAVEPGDGESVTPSEFLLHRATAQDLPSVAWLTIVDEAAQEVHDGTGR